MAVSGFGLIATGEAKGATAVDVSSSGSVQSIDFLIDENPSWIE